MLMMLHSDSICFPAWPGLLECQFCLFSASPGLTLLCSALLWNRDLELLSACSTPLLTLLVAQPPHGAQLLARNTALRRQVNGTAASDPRL
jgi:hypothetical protein